MSFPHWFQPLRRTSLIAVAVLLAASVAIAQTALVQDQSGATGYSSSQAGLSASGLQLSELSLSDSPTPGASALGGGMYGSDSGHTEIFAEARYTFIHTPAVTQTNGLGTTELIPVTLGVRF